MIFFLADWQAREYLNWQGQRSTRRGLCLNPVQEALRADDGALHHRLLSIREETGLPEEIFALRVFDVIAWMDGKNRGLGDGSDLRRCHAPDCGSDGAAE